jgi:uncharacterized protein
MRIRYFCLIVLITVIVTSVFSLEAPLLNKRVNDFAGMISEKTEQQMTQMLYDLEVTDGTQIVVLTIESLEGEPLEDFSLRVAEKNGIGQKENDNGALLLVSKIDKKIRIEVGYGLEGVLTDLLSGRIIDNEITPLFKQNDYNGGFLAGVNAMIGAVRGEYTSESSSQSGRGFLSRYSNLMFIPFIFLFGIFRFASLLMIGRRRRGIIPMILFGGGLNRSSRSGFSSGGGFSGGGGGFGGGGASGGW